MTDNQEAVAATEEEMTILIEWADAAPGWQKAARGDRLKSMQEQSQRALNMAMGTIRAMAYRVAKAMEEMGDQVRPDEAEIEFGVSLGAEAGAFLAKASSDAQLKIKLKWTVEQPERARILVKD